MNNIETSFDFEACFDSWQSRIDQVHIELPKQLSKIGQKRVKPTFHEDYLEQFSSGRPIRIVKDYYDQEYKFAHGLNYLEPVVLDY
jgi:hypothetical protein